MLFITLNFYIQFVLFNNVQCLKSRDGSITMFLNAAVATLFSLVFGSSCHVFIIALQKLRRKTLFIQQSMRKVFLYFNKLRRKVLFIQQSIENLFYSTNNTTKNRKNNCSSLCIMSIKLTLICRSVELGYRFDL
jgi:hypothetical protein